MVKNINIKNKLIKFRSILQNKASNSSYNQGSFIFNKEESGHKKNRALLAYRTKPVADFLMNKKINQFSSDGAVVSICKTLGRLGYIVEVIDWDDINPSLGNEYDLVIVHGSLNYKKILKHIKNEGLLIYYSTGSYWKYHNAQEKERYQKFNKRHNQNLRPDRKIENSEDEINRMAEMIISLGNKDTASTYSGFKNVKYLHAASIKESRKVPIQNKDYLSAKKNFLFMSGPGGIHKGLDWAIDYFIKHPELHLHIMMTLEDDFIAYYKEALYHTANIHYYGYVEQRSQKFYSIIDQCAFSILLSCSEGSPGSVIESMHQGLIPIVTSTSHIDISGCGYTIKDLNFKTLSYGIDKLSGKSVSELKKMAAMSNNLIEESYTVEKFEKKLFEIIKSAERHSK
jgi:hypothetical protein